MGLGRFALSATAIIFKDKGKRNSRNIYPKSREEWRQWLHDNHDAKQLVWLVYFRNVPGKETVTYAEAVDEALCYGWIDSTLRSPGEGMLMQQFTRRKPTSVWSQINKAKIKRLIASGLMAEPGLRSINIAKRNGSWSVYDDIEKMVIPRDLGAAFRKHPGSRRYFVTLSNSIKKQILHWIVQAKRPETREKRIIDVATLAAVHKKPAQFR